MATATTKKTKKSDVRTWTQINGRMRLWGKEVETSRKGKDKTFITYSATVGAKNEDGEYENLYYDVRFKKDEAPDILESFIIDVKEGFLTVTTAKDGRHYPAVMILDYEVIDEE